LIEKRTAAPRHLADIGWIAHRRDDLRLDRLDRYIIDRDTPLLCD
jgi:hypothetical protein